MHEVEGGAARACLDDDFADFPCFSIMSALQDGAELESRTLQRVLRCERARLSGALARLEQEGHLVVRYVSFNGAPGGWVRATPRGQEAFAAHLQALREIVALSGGQAL